MAVKCASCVLAEEGVGDTEGNVVTHCFGKGKVLAIAPPHEESCTCECVSHTFPPGDIRFQLIEMLTAEAHDEHDLLKSLIASYDNDETRTLLLLSVKFNIAMLRQAAIDPIEHVRTAAMYWQGGEPGDEPEAEDAD